MQSNRVVHFHFLTLLFFSIFCLLAKAQTPVDSLEAVEMHSRDSAWIAQSLETSYAIMYSEPARSSQFLVEIGRTAETNKMSRFLPRIFLNMGIACDVMNKPDSALYLYRKGLSLAQNFADTNMIASAFNNIGLIYWNEEQLDSAIYFYKKAEFLFESIEQFSGYTSTINNIGLIYMSLSRYDDAKRYFHRVINASAKLDSRYFESVAYQNLGLAYTYINNDSTQFYYKKAIDIQIAENNLWGLAKSYHNLSTSLFTSERYDEAATILLKAIAINEKLKDYHGLASNYFQLAWQFEQGGEFDKMEAYLEQADSYDTLYEDVDLRQKIDFDLALVKVRKFNRRLYESLRESRNLSDSLHLAMMEGKAMELEKKYETQKKEQQLEIQALELEGEKRKSRNRLFLGVALGLVLILVVVGAFLFLSYRHKVQKLKSIAALHAERSRISKDLHDNVGAQLTSIGMRVDMLQYKMGDNEPIPELEKIKEEASQSVEVLRDTIWAIHQNVFELKDFIKRIEAYAKRNLPEGISCVVTNKIENSFELDSLTALNLFRIVQEALQNVLKHSEADKVKICFSAMPALLVSISDNGEGSAAFKSESPDHYGLENMRERAKEMGAVSRFISSVGKGFTLEIEF